MKVMPLRLRACSYALFRGIAFLLLTSRSPDLLNTSNATFVGVKPLFAEF